MLIIYHFFTQCQYIFQLFGPAIDQFFGPVIELIREIAITSKLEGGDRVPVDVIELIRNRAIVYFIKTALQLMLKNLLHYFKSDKLEAWKRSE